MYLPFYFKEYSQPTKEENCAMDATPSVWRCWLCCWGQVSLCPGAVARQTLLTQISSLISWALPPPNFIMPAARVLLQRNLCQTLWFTLRKYQPARVREWCDKSGKHKSDCRMLYLFCAHRLWQGQQRALHLYGSYPQEEAEDRASRLERGGQGGQELTCRRGLKTSYITPRHQTIDWSGAQVQELSG